MDQRDQNTRDMSLRDSNMAGTSQRGSNTQDTSPGVPNSKEPQVEMLRTSRTSPRGSDLSQTGRHREGTPIPQSCPPPTPAAGHLNPSTTSIPHYLPSPCPTDWTFHLPDLDAYRSSNAEGLQPFQKTLLFCATASSKFHKFKKIFSLLIYPTSQVYILITIIYNAFQPYTVKKICK